MGVPEEEEEEEEERVAVKATVAGHIYHHHPIQISPGLLRFYGPTDESAALSPSFSLISSSLYYSLFFRSIPRK